MPDDNRFDVGDRIVIFKRYPYDEGKIEYHDEGEVVAVAEKNLIKVRTNFLWGTTEDWYQENDANFLFARVVSTKG